MEKGKVPDRFTMSQQLHKPNQSGFFPLSDIRKTRGVDKSIQMIGIASLDR
jgi:hypothetical protein